MADSNRSIVLDTPKTNKGGYLVDANKKFVAGTKGGPGRPPRTRDFYSELKVELERVERKQKKTFFRHRWEEAFKNSATASDMMGYLLSKQKPTDYVEPPDLTINNPASVVVFQGGTPDLTHNGHSNGHA